MSGRNKGNNMKKEPVDAIKAMESMMTPESIERSDAIFREEMAKIEDGIRPLKSGDVFDIGQTVNGQSVFFMMDADTLDIRYAYDHTRRYEYNAEELIAPDRWTGEQTYTIIGNIHDTHTTEAGR